MKVSPSIHLVFNDFMFKIAENLYTEVFWCGDFKNRVKSFSLSIFGIHKFLESIFGIQKLREKNFRLDFWIALKKYLLAYFTVFDVFLGLKSIFEISKSQKWTVK